MVFLEQPIRLLALALMAGRFVYWTIQERRAHREKPKTIKISLKILVSRLIITLLNLLLYFQLLGLDLLSYENSVSNLLLGFTLIIMATVISYLARAQLGDNWAHASEYQIKRNHELVKTGIYAYIRHPIYLGVIFTFLGVQLIVGSYLVLLFMIIMPWLAYFQAKKEEKILQAHFGSEYEEYRKTTYLFLPYLL